MSEIKNTYEGMFLLDAGNPDLNAATDAVSGILNRREAEILSLKPWDERRLAYEIKGRKRGLYVLGYFKLDPAQVVEIEHDCQLDERILRAMLLRRDNLTEQEIAAETPSESTAARQAEAPEETSTEADEEKSEVEDDKAQDSDKDEEQEEDEPKDA